MRVNYFIETIIPVTNQNALFSR